MRRKTFDMILSAGGAVLVVVLLAAGALAGTGRLSLFGFCSLSATVAQRTGAMTNHLYYGDNLEILRAHINDETVDLVYLDPPFNSQATYNVLFKATSGEQSKAQIEAFEDTWH